MIPLIIFRLVSAVTYTPVSNGFSITASPSTGGQTCFTVHSAESGWAAIGVGSGSMSGADIYLGWKSSQGAISVGNFEGSGHVQPSANSVQNAQQVTLLETSPSWAKLSFSFCRPTAISSNGKSITPDQSYIYASCPDQPSGSSPSNLRFSQHAGTYGSFAIDFTSTANTTVVGSTNNPFLFPSGSFSYQQIVALHGILMFIAWSVSPFIGIFIARYTKDLLGHNWYRLHVFFMGVGCGLFSTFILPTSASSIMFLANARWSPERTFIPWWDTLHWWFGRSLFLLGLVNVYLGLSLYDDNYVLATWVTPVYWVVVVLGIGLLVFGQVTIGQVHHLKKQQEEQKNLIAL
ncbi:hypothetical protein HK103_003108 [Boothiomyces macroporosus]|uniref:DOMON domain-containing protein n=1 Tax=Boothiomyces macroporosus TaxID=261099 RepID=A0AAD5UID4_9FUNG|nr:hypothetical protein HK103_003108 [Boothiomyces macroporosus]